MISLPVTSNRILLSFDVEEFDLPLEYGYTIPMVDQMQATAEGLEIVLALLDRVGVTATFFTTARFAVRHPDLVRSVAVRHEIASHGFAHSHFVESDLVESRLVLEEIVGRPVLGFRRPYLQFTDPDLIARAGYLYDSSENPIWLPGRYNNLFRKRTVSRSGNLWRIPVSATPWVRIPLFWLSFKNLPFVVIKAATAWTLSRDSYLNIFYHPWEFLDLTAYPVPWFVKRIHGADLEKRLETYLKWLMFRGRFMTFSAFAGLPPLS
jgi:peptidoglycan/xylan/chitin deacetylase (PgdA/CDA1 family)